MENSLDNLILDEMRRHTYNVTYAIANGIHMTTGYRYRSSAILRRLRALEAVGYVRCLGFRGNMYEWALA